MLAQARVKNGRGHANRMSGHFPGNTTGCVNEPMLAIHIRRFSTCNQARQNHTSGLPHSPVCEARNPSFESPAPPPMTGEEKVDVEKDINFKQGILTGKRCLITGASRGIGKAIAKRFADEGAWCVLVGRKGETLLGVMKELKGYEAEAAAQEKDLGKNHRVVEGDVGDARFWEGFRKEVRLRFPSPAV